VKWIDRLFLRQFDALDLFELLDAALHLLRLRGLVAKAIDKGFQMLDVLALIAIGGFNWARRSCFCSR